MLEGSDTITVGETTAFGQAGGMISFVDAPNAFADLIRVGSMRRQVEGVRRMLRDQAHVVLVTLPEEMRNLSIIDLDGNRLSNFRLPANLPRLGTLNLRNNLLTNLALPAGMTISLAVTMGRPLASLTSGYWNSHHHCWPMTVT